MQLQDSKISVASSLPSNKPADLICSADKTFQETLCKYVLGAKDENQVINYIEVSISDFGHTNPLCSLYSSPTFSDPVK